jgi:pyruvate dehydrogenase E1 component
LSTERDNRLHPSRPPEAPYVTDALAHCDGPVVAVTEYMKAVPEQIARWVPAPFTVLGTDGYGRSDTRDALRRHFEVDAAHIVVAVLHALGKADQVADAIKKYGIDADAPDPRSA